MKTIHLISLKLTVGVKQYNKSLNLNFLSIPIKFCNLKNIRNTETKKYMLELRTICKMIEPCVIYYKRLIKSYNNTVHNILENEITFTPTSNS